MALQWKVFLTNAAVLIAATLVLLLSPATVSFPVALAEIFAVAGGVAALLLLDFALLQRAFAPLRRLREVMGRVDPLAPGQRAVVDTSDREVLELAAAFNTMLGRLERERRESARNALAAQEGERIRIARELHDGVGQALTAIVLELDQVGRRPPGPQTGVELLRARDAVRASLEEVRDIARGLRPEALDDLGLRSALTSLASRIERQTGVNVRRELQTGLPPLGSEAELVVYRVAQEALTNVVRHAKVREARLSLTAAIAGGTVTLAVADGGAGFDLRSADGSGLLGMRERAVLAGGVLRVQTSPGAGTTITLTVPTVGSHA